MSLPNDSRDNRNITLPSGKTVVVNYVHDHAPAAAPAHDPEQHLEVCGACASRLVHPVRWEEAGTSHWQILLRCPECEWEGTGVFENRDVERFDEILETGTDDLVADLRSIERANMVDFADRFLDALHAGHIFPADF